MRDLTTLSILQVAALRRMTEDRALAEQCDSCLRERGVRGIRYFLINRFALLGAAFDAFLAYEWDDEDVPSPRVLIWSGAIVIVLIAAFFAFLAFAFIQIRSWWGRGVLLLVILLIVAWNEWDWRRRTRPRSVDESKRQRPP